MAYTYSKKIVILARALENTAFYIHKIFSIRKTKAEGEGEIEKIMIFEPFQLGDVVSLSVMIEPLKNKFPCCSAAGKFVLDNLAAIGSALLYQRVILATMKPD